MLAVGERPQPGEVWTNVDWITATRSGDQLDQPLYALGEALLLLEDPSHDQTSPQTLLGYVGSAAPGIFVGKRSDGSMVRLSGSKAASWWRQVVNCCTNVSRLDLAVTVALKEPKPRLAMEHYKRCRQVTTATGRPPKYSLLVDTLGGQTIYVGARSSDLYARLYDKGVESGLAEQGELWRYEVEVKAKAAGSLALDLCSKGDPSPAICGYVFDHFADRGIQPEFARGVGEYRVGDSKVSADIASVLGWLHRSVRPTLHRLCASGHQRECWRALDLSELFGYAT